MNLKRIESDYPGNIEVQWNDGSELAVRGYDPSMIDGKADGLEHGETFTFPDGGTVTRLGDKTVWVTASRA
jgi:hypothetical protein